MDNMLIKDEYFLNNCFQKNGKINYHVIKKLSEDHINYLFNRFEYIDNINEALFRLKNNINIRPICCICGKKVKFYGNGYSECCSPECSNKLIQQRIKNNSIIKYGVSHPTKTKENIQKHKEYYNNNNIKEKLHNATKNKYGVDNVFQLNEVKEKIKQTWIKKYGVDNPSKSEEIKNKTKKINNEKYGVDYFVQSTLFKEKQQETLNNKYHTDNISKLDFIKNKIQKTNLLKYGYICPLMDKNIKYKNISKAECIEKQINSLIKNGNSNKSKPEIISFDLLKQKYSDVIHHYKDHRYPFNCDFYIPTLDLFIECQYGIFHNGRPYLGIKKDLEDIKILKQKSEQRKQKTGNKKSKYDSIIYTWSDLDVRKRNIAKQNHLNYIEFWNIDELKKWLKI